MARKKTNEYYENFKDKIEEYSNVSELSKNNIGGRSEKRFVRIDDTKNTLKRKRNLIPYMQKTAKNSLFFGELFRDLRLGNSKWKTYLNDDLFGKKRKETYLPDKVSCLIKSFSIDEGQDPYIAEHIGCRIANVCGIDSVFNIAHPEPISEEDHEYMSVVHDTYDYVISVDYVPWGYTSEKFSELDIGFHSETPLEEIMAEINEKFPYLEEKYGLKRDEKLFYQFKKDFAKQFLLKQFICDDYDCWPRNFALLIAENGEYNMAPCFDMEWFFRGGMSGRFYETFATSTIKFLLNNMPDVLDEFVKRVKSAYISGDISKAIMSSLRVNQFYLQGIDKKIGTNIKRFDSYYNSLKSEYQNGQDIDFVN